MKQRFSQKGFGAPVLLLVLAVVLVVGGIGAYLYTGHHSKNGTSKTTVKLPALNEVTTSPNGIPGGATGAAANNRTSPAPDVNIVKVPEAGFQITVPDSIRDLTYHVAVGPNATIAVTFSTVSLTTLVPQCEAANNTGAFTTVLSGKGDYIPPANPADGKLIKQNNGSYLAYLLPTGPCAKGLSVTAQNLLDDQAQAFTNSLASVKAL